MTAGPGSSSSPFRVRTFRSLWIASVMSHFGTQVQMVGAAWLMVSLTSSEGMVALVQAAVWLPQTVFSLFAGVVADNFDRRKVMLTAQCTMFAVSVALTVLAFAGVLSPWSLLGFTFLIGCGGALNAPSWQASVGDIVPRDDIPQAVTLNAMGYNGMRSLGPALGGLIVATAGAAWAFAVNAASFIGIIFALKAWNPPATERPLPRESFAGAISGGLRYTSMSPDLQRLIFRALLFGSSAIVTPALLPVLVRDTLEGTANTFGLMLAFFGAGAVVAAAINRPLRRRFENEGVARLGFIGSAIGTLTLALSASPWICAPALLLSGCGWVLVLSILNSSTQLFSPRWVVGRVMSIYQAGAFGGMALGSLLWGWAAETAGLTATFLAAALVLALGALIGLWKPLPSVSTANLEPLNRFRTPEAKLGLTYKAGPIMVVVEYLIDTGDTEAFLQLMARRRRIRIRDGAKQWVLLRDIERPEQWSESYHVATWGDYIRHNQRRTAADAEVFDNLRLLHRGPGTPVVRRLIERQWVSSKEADTAYPVRSS
ncbi:MFS transporter [Pseudoruegeria sp. HB172150]|uniref:MFS transporter n=1 Tax=Pseudoruegeria sp. HB172150 TaxID=2721164 RepID=UPI00352CA95A